MPGEQPHVAATTISRVLHLVQRDAFALGDVSCATALCQTPVHTPVVLARARPHRSSSASWWTRAPTPPAGGSRCRSRGGGECPFSAPQRQFSTVVMSTVKSNRLLISTIKLRSPFASRCVSSPSPPFAPAGLRQGTPTDCSAPAPRCPQRGYPSTARRGGQNDVSRPREARAEHLGVLHHTHEEAEVFHEWT